jgi:hypothetical protein
MLMKYLGYWDSGGGGEPEKEILGDTAAGGSQRRTTRDAMLQASMAPKTPAEPRVDVAPLSGRAGGGRFTTVGVGEPEPELALDEGEVVVLVLLPEVPGAGAAEQNQDETSHLSSEREINTHCPMA